MPHLHTNDYEYDHTVSAFIIKPPTASLPEPTLLLHHHKKLGVLLQPGGHIEITENPWAAVVHELEEETGYLPEQLQVLQPYAQSPFLELDHSVIHPTPILVSSHGFKKWSTHYHTDSTYAFVTEQAPAKPVAEGESDSFIWVTLTKLQTLPEGSIVEGARQVGVQALTFFYRNWFPVPAATFSGDNPPAF